MLQKLRLSLLNITIFRRYSSLNLKKKYENLQIIQNSQANFEIIYNSKTMKTPSKKTLLSLISHFLRLIISI